MNKLLSSHPYNGLSGFIRNNSVKKSDYSEFDPESGTLGRKRSLVRRERSLRGRNGSVTSNNNSGSTNNNGSTGFTRSSSSRTSLPRTNDIQLHDIARNSYSAPSSSAPREFHGLNDEVSRDSYQGDKRRITRDESFRGNKNSIDNNTSQLSNVPNLRHENILDEEGLDQEQGSPSIHQSSLKGAGDSSDLGPVYSKDAAESYHDYEDETSPLNEEGYASYTKPNFEDFSKHFPYWKVYCYVVTFWAPAPLLNLFGFTTKERQYAWREKMALISVILCFGAVIVFLTFAFTRTACVHTTKRIHSSNINTGYLIINGRAFDLTSSSHPAVPGIDAGSNILYPPTNAGGKDASFLFQNVNGNCKGLITPRDNSTIPYNDDELAWYMPCKVFEMDGSTSPNFTYDYYNGYACHTSTKARNTYYSLDVTGDVYYTWDDITNSSRNLVVYNGDVLDMDLISWFQSDDLEYPELFDRLQNDDLMKGYDISVLLTTPHERKAANCLVDIVKVGVIDSDTIGCIASSIVLYVSLVFVLLISFSKFFIACYFKWAVAPKQGASESAIKDMVARDRATNEWSDDPLSSAPIKDVPEKRRANYHTRTQSKMFGRKGLRTSWGGGMEGFLDEAETPELLSGEDYHPKYLTVTTEAYLLANKKKSHNRSGSRQSLMLNNFSNAELSSADPFRNSVMDLNENVDTIQTLDPALIHPDAIAQPPVSWEPFNYPLAHTLCLVTCYSEDEAGIRTTLDSIATTDYPNSHKLIFIVCDGLITGAGNSKSTPDICLDLMSDFATNPDEVQPYSYVSVVQGTKRHNMAKVYSGFYKYSDETVPPEKQQKIPVLLIVKCGTPDEISSPKPGNRGKRDSQIILMSFLQKVTYNERMTELEFEILRSIWRITGLMGTFYELVLMVDADTLVYPDSITHMAAEMVKYPDIMGLCGETKISNKTQSWVTAIQVFEYYISHHQAKAFESVFGSVTCLPGCFSMYRIKSPKDLNAWVPILANSDIVEKYSENVLDSLHKKNLLLLGEDRYLSSLMLRNFPRRRQVFVPKAVCKTVAPDSFKVLLSQRRRWINSTVHNLMELVLVKDLCGTFCLSMQFIIGVELIGTLVLPASITITIYVIVVAIVSKPTPVMSLILLGIVFGLPAVLVTVTVSSLIYIVWMLVYLCSLPIWNFVLPVYAFWKFDDFSWGDTRKTEGGGKGSHDNSEGEFDGSKIVQKTWVEYERDSRGLNNNYQSVPNVYNPGYVIDDSTDYDDTNVFDDTNAEYNKRKSTDELNIIDMSYKANHSHE